MYIDEFVICAKNVEEHDRLFNDMIDKQRQANLKLNANKCKLKKVRSNISGACVEWTRNLTRPEAGGGKAKLS